MQLTDEKKSMIREEEIYRAEVREQLAQSTNGKSPLKRVWNWLGTPLGLWFLSAVLLASITEGYKAFQARQAEAHAAADAQRAKEAERLELIRKLDGEIALRLNTVRDRVLAFGQKKLTKLDIEDAGKIVHYPEFRERSLSSLMFELQSLLTGKEQTTVQLAMGKWFILQHWEAHKGFAERSGRPFSALGFFLPLLNDIYIERWRKDINAIITAGHELNADGAR